MRGRLAKKLYDRDHRHEPISKPWPRATKKWLVRAWKRASHRSTHLDKDQRSNKREHALLGYSNRRRNCKVSIDKVHANVHLYLRKHVADGLVKRRRVHSSFNAITFDASQDEIVNGRTLTFTHVYSGTFKNN